MNYHPCLFSVDQWFTSEEDKTMNKGTKIGEAEDFGGDPSKCCEKCFGVAPLTNAGIFYIYRCVCFQVTGGFHNSLPFDYDEGKNISTC